MKTKIYTCFLSLLVSLCSCNSFLDETPKGTLIPHTTDDFGLLFDDYADDNHIAYGQTLTWMMSDDFTMPDEKFHFFDTESVNAYTWADHLFTISEDDPAYNRFYHVIFICNYVLANLDKAGKGTQYTREYVEGSAHFHRAYSYLMLVNLYARHYDRQTAAKDLGVPLPLVAEPDARLKRATVQEVYEQILSDLLAAEPLLGEKEPYPFRATRAAADALLARTYLYMGDYKECLEAARKARKLVGEPTDFNQYGPVDGNPDFGIDGWPYDKWDQPEIICYKGDGYGPNSDEAYNLSDDLAALFNPETDLRWQLFITTYQPYGDEPDEDTPRTVGFLFPNNRGLNVGEVYLTEAEACVREGDIDGALDALNTLSRNRHVTGTYVDVTERNPDKLLSLILDERRRELMMKGIRWFDLKRLNKDPRFARTITHTLRGKTYTLKPGDNHYVLPIPANVIDRNNLIEQNPR